MPKWRRTQVRLAKVTNHNFPNEGGMETDARRGARANRLRLLTQCGAETLMGKLLRQFWQPIAQSHTLDAGKARALTVMHEDLTLFRGENGSPFLVGGRCAHRCTVLHTGWVQGDEIRCMYHGWKFAGSDGRCTEMPAERNAQLDRARIAAYPLREYGGLIFAYLGGGEPPSFELPRKSALERPGYRTGTLEAVWDCNWFQHVENSLDALHVSFVHAWASESRFSDEITTALPELSFEETSAGLRQTAKRSEHNVRISDWTFPNNNHIVEPGPRKGDPWIDTCVWAVPIDDRSTRRFFIYAYPGQDEDAARRIAADRSNRYDFVEHRDELFTGHRLPASGSLDLLQAQDYVAVRGQGVIVDRGAEQLGQSDSGIALLRKVFLRELDAIRDGRPVKRWTPLDAAHDLPTQTPIAGEPLSK
jgi:5,5'-dehydrodivanillate O-demethylase oxygenase subunit